MSLCCRNGECKTHCNKKHPYTASWVPGVWVCGLWKGHEKRGNLSQPCGMYLKLGLVPAIKRTILIQVSKWCIQ